MLNYLREALADPGVRGFLSGLFPGLLLALAAFLREVYFDRKRAVREEGAARSARVADRFLRFEAPFIRFLPLFEKWSRDEDIAIWLEYECGAQNWESKEDKKRRVELSRELDAGLSELLVLSPNAALRSAVRDARNQLRRFRSVSVSASGQLARWRGEHPDPGTETPPKEIHEELTRERLRLAKIVDSISEAHAGGALHDYQP